MQTLIELHNKILSKETPIQPSSTMNNSYKNRKDNMNLTVLGKKYTPMDMHGKVSGMSNINPKNKSHGANSPTVYVPGRGGLSDLKHLD